MIIELDLTPMEKAELSAILMNRAVWIRKQIATNELMECAFEQEQKTIIKILALLNGEG